MAFGFIKGAAQKAGKKMYGYGQRGAQVVRDNPGAGIAAAGVGGTIGLTQAGVLEADWDGSKQFANEDSANQEQALKIAIQREIEGNQSRDHHLDNLKVIRSFALNNPDRFAGFIEMLKSSEKGMAFANQLRNSYSEYKDTDMVSLIGQ